jgi:hypothetical protein
MKKPIKSSDGPQAMKVKSNIRAGSTSPVKLEPPDPC